MELAQVKVILSAHQDELRAMDVKSLAVFGSIARGEARPDGDVDLLVEFDRPVDLFEFGEVKDFLECIIEHPIHLFTIGSLQPPLRDIVLAEAIRAS